MIVTNLPYYYHNYLHLCKETHPFIMDISLKGCDSLVLLMKARDLTIRQDSTISTLQLLY